MAGGLRIARETYDIRSVDSAEVLRYLGYHGQGLADELAGRIDRQVGRCLALARPRATLASFAIRAAGPGSIELEGCTLRLQGRDIARHLDGATEAVLMAITLGADIDRELRRLSVVDALEQVVLDAAATALAERAADAAEAHARAYATERGGYPSWRYSPGYGDFPLDCQAEFLAVLDAGRQLGITLTPSNLMVPTKSVTAVVGVHPTPQPDVGEACATCNLRDFCTIRQSGHTCRSRA